MDNMRVYEIRASIMARHLCTDIARVVSFTPDDEATHARETLNNLSIDRAPVRSVDAFVGLVERSSLTSGKVSDHMMQLKANVLVSADTPFEHLLADLQAEPLLLVLEERRVIGVVTAEDAGGAAARTHYYLLLARLEMLLAEMIRTLHPDQAQAVGLLSPGRQAKYQEIRAALVKEDLMIDDVACLSLLDLIAIARSDVAYRELATASGRGWGGLVDSLANFRNDVMHPVRTFAKANQDGLATLRSVNDALVTLATAAEDRITMLRADRFQ